MKFVTLIVLIIALAIPASASSVVSWTHEDITGYNLTLNYTSEFNVAKHDILGISIINIGNKSENDTITINKINVSDTTKATGSQEGSWVIGPGSNQTIYFMLNMTTNDAVDLDIKIHYNVSSENKTLSVTAKYPGAPKITPWNNKSNSVATTLTVNTSEFVRFNATANQQVNSWNWYKDNEKQSPTDDHFITSWNDAGAKIIKVNATNANGTSNTITWNVAVNALSGLPAPNITSWSNSKTNNNKSLTINETESVRFNFTANQTLTFWSWKLNGINIRNHSDNLTHAFNNHGSYTLNASGSNDNGSTQTIVWNINVLEKEGKKKNATILDWYPEVVDYVYINGTVYEKINYSITTAEEMAIFNWTVDGGNPETGNESDNTYYYNYTWDNNSRLGAHTIIFKGSNNDTRVEFRWYVNVYRIGKEECCSCSIFDIIDDALENHVTDIKIRMFRYKIAKHAGKSEIAVQKVNQLHDEIAKRQMTREALRAEFKAGIITSEIYTAAMKQVQREAKYNSKLAEGYAKISIEDLKDDKSKDDFKKISEMENKNDKRKDGGNSKGKEDTSTKGKPIEDLKDDKSKDDFKNISEMENKNDKGKDGANSKGKEDAGTKGKPIEDLKDDKSKDDFKNISEMENKNNKGNNKDNENKNNGRGKD
jgi:predicted transcriptional regulator